MAAAVGIGPGAEEARDVRSRVELMARDMAKASQQRTATRKSAPLVVGAAAAAAAAEGEAGDARNSLGGGTASDTDGEGGAGIGSVSRRRKGRGRRPGSESESEGGVGSLSWVYMSKAWALKWATSAYPGPVSNHHVVCRHGRVKPNVGVKRWARGKEGTGGERKGYKGVGLCFGRNLWWYVRREKGPSYMGSGTKHDKEVGGFG